MAHRIGKAARLAILNRRGESHAISPIVSGNGALRSDPAQTVQVLDDECLRAAASGGDTRRCASRAASNHNHVIPAEDRQRSRDALGTNTNITTGSR